MNDDAKPTQTAADYMRIARQGAEFWNRWLRAALDALIAEAGDENRKSHLQLLLAELRLADMAPLGEAEWRKLGWERLPRLEIPADPDQSSIDFTGVDFRAEAAAIDFSGFSFPPETSFAGATFGDGAGFADATFGDRVSFEGWAGDKAKARFEALAGSFMPAGAQRDAWVNRRIQSARPGAFSSISFAGARFAGDCSFSGRTFAGSASFRNVRFGAPPEFAGTEGHGFIDPHGMAVTFPCRRWPFANRDVESETDARIRRLRKVMADIHAQDVERDLFILERQAQRAIAWNGFVDRFKKSEKAGESELRSKPEGKLWRRALTAIAIPFGIFKPLGFSLLLLAYGLASNYGRSIARPFIWLFVSVTAFHALYWQIWAAPVRKLGFWERDLVSYSIGNLVPFVNALSPARGELLKRLFCPTDLAGKCIASPLGEIVVPLRVEGLALLEGVVNAALLFLLLQAIRNYFKMTK